MGPTNYNHAIDILIFYHPQKVLRGFKLPKGNHRSILKDALLEEWSLTVSLKYYFPLRHLQSQAVFPFRGPRYGKRPRLNAQFYYSVMSPQPHSQHSTWRGCAFLTTPQKTTTTTTKPQFYLFFGHTAQLVGSQFPDQVLNLSHGSESQNPNHQANREHPFVFFLDGPTANFVFLSS